MSNNNNNSKPRAQWASSIGFILAAAGSAVGLGNIWKFPGKAYNGGGSAFIVIYILIVALIGTSVMLAEFAVGRHGQKSPFGAFGKINNGKWAWVGALGLITAVIIVSYYVQVGGWVLKYIVAYLIDSASIYADPKGYFFNVLGVNGMPWEAAVIFPILFIVICIAILFGGVQGGIEKVNKVLIPGLFILLIVLTIRSVTLPGAMEGVKYLLIPDFSKVNGETFLTALGQAFFSLSLGMGIMSTYSSYVSKEENLIKNAGIVCCIDTCVAILAGFMIIPAVFAAGVEPGMGGSFAFVSLAGVFQSMPMGFIFGAMFYCLLLFAAITSAISLMEGPVAYLVEEHNIDRKKAIIGLSIFMFCLGIFYTLSQAFLPVKGVWFDAVNGMTTPGFGDFLEFLTDRLLIPVTAIACCVYVGWAWGPKKAAEELKYGGKEFSLENVWSILVKFVAPAAIILILVCSFATGTTLS
ncbi:MAG: sodium-dependent transporter [Oscillospiraceae bacterium]|nr:sodium-dependent transporter [Oscillospiraceae bacterium]